MGKNTYVRESYLSRIRPFIGKDVVKVITGMRRCGKSTIMDQMMSELISGGVSDDRILKYDLESRNTPRFKDADDMYDSIASWASGKGHVHVFLDEIQNLDGWHTCVRAILTDLDADIYITGSSSKMLSGEMATHLAGRYVEIGILPFSFSEVVGVERMRRGSRTVEELFDLYLHHGGMPLIVMNGYDPLMTDSMLTAMYDSVVINDIAGRKGIRNTMALKEVLGYAMSEIGHVVNSTNVGNYLKSQGKKASADSILEYLDAAEDAMFLSRVPRMDIRGREILRIDHKYYMTDLGMREANGMSNTLSIDQVLENIVYNELRFRGYDVCIGRNDGLEVDFVATKGKVTEYYQVSYLLASESTVEREFRSLESIGDNFPKHVLSMDSLDRGRNGIIHRNIVDWLLDH